MSFDTPHHKPCSICHSRPANKTNSHLIPSFFIAMVSSIDDSYRRDKELLFTIGDRATTAYIGRSVREDELLHIFNNLSEDRLDRMTKLSAAKDYIFCSHCEKKIGEYLESPWHDYLFEGRRTPADTAYFFWVSLLWRISAFEGLSLKLPTHIEEGLRKRLNAFINAKDNQDETTQLMIKAPFIYKVLYCKDFSRKNAGIIYYEYDRKSKIATLLLGDVAACFNFHKHGSFDGHSFYGLENSFAEAPVNDGSKIEDIVFISDSVLEKTVNQILAKCQTNRLNSDRANILFMWKLVREKLGIPLPIKPDEVFLRYVILELNSDSAKIGEC